jgi:hypothetical protein
MSRAITALAASLTVLALGGAEGGGGCAASDAGTFAGDAGPESNGAEREVDGLCPDVLDTEDPDCTGPQNLESVCAELVERSCGETCGESPSCAAAHLLQTYEPDGCPDALTDTQTYPACQLGSCESLVIKACGPADECADAPGCDPAKQLDARRADPEASQDEVAQATAACLQALEDEVVFAPCT